MKHSHIAKKIIGLKNADLNLRNKLIDAGQLGSGGYNEEMKSLHISNANALYEIIEEIGYPTVSKVGIEANEAAWLVIQHSIGQPHFMRKCLELLESIDSDEDSISLKHLAYLSDRIAVFEGKDQLYGTQFDWDKNGQLSPQSYDDIAKVNTRRKSIGLNTLEEQIMIIRKRSIDENDSPPKDYEKRKQEMFRWSKEVGWIE